MTSHSATTGPGDRPELAELPGGDPSLVDADAVGRSLGTDAGSGLSSAEAATRRARVGPNLLVPAAPVPSWGKLLA